MTARIALVLAGALATVAVGVGAGAPAAQAATHSVTMSNYAFGPTDLTVQVGDAVTWTNHDTAPHDVTTTAGPLAIHSPTLTKGQSWTYVFAKPGTYRYICSIHPDMHATITVNAAPVARSTTAKAQALPAPAPATSAARTASATHARATHAGTSAAAQPGRSATPAAATTPAVAAAGDTAVSSPSSTTRLKPLLLLAGLAAAVATLCLLTLAARPDET